MAGYVDAVLAVLDDWRTVDEVWRRSGVRRRTVRYHLGRLAEEGIVEVDRSCGRCGRADCEGAMLAGGPRYRRRSTIAVSARG